MGKVLLLYEPLDRCPPPEFPLMATSMAERECGALLLGIVPPTPLPGLRLSGVTDRRSPEELYLETCLTGYVVVKWNIRL